MSNVVVRARLTGEWGVETELRQLGGGVEVDISAGVVELLVPRDVDFLSSRQMEVL